MKVLLADDDESMRTLVGFVVRSMGHEVIVACDGEEAWALIASERPDLAILDVMMPKIDGYDLTARLRVAGNEVLVLLLTAKGDIVDKSSGFRAGADDYLVKPFIPEELQLRIEALLRRARSAPPSTRSDEALEVLEVDGLMIDRRRRRVTLDGRLIELTPKEFHLLHLLAANRGVVFTREQLTTDIWGEGYYGEASAVAVLVHRLREKLEADPRNPHFIQTVWHVGYRFLS